MTKVSLEWDAGMGQLLNYTKLKAYATEKDAQAVVKNNLVEMQGYAFRKAAWKTGWMRDNFMLSYQDGGLQGTMTGEVPYTVYVEYGTMYQEAQPAIRAAFMIYRLQFLKDMVKIIDRRSKYGGSSI